MNNLRVKCELMKRKEVPKKLKLIAMAPLVFTMVTARV